MSYYNYHAKIKQKILNQELLKFKIVDNYKHISPALVLYFSDGKIYPIREHKWEEYFNLFSKIK